MSKKGAGSHLSEAKVRTVVEAGKALGVEVAPREFPEGTRSAANAARAIGVDVGAIVKSLLFAVDGEAVVALVSGANLLDEGKLATAAGGTSAWREDADTVREVTGFPVGGVPPFGHRQPLRTFVDEDLTRYDEVWAAAGTVSVNFSIEPGALVRATGGTVYDLARRQRVSALTRSLRSLRSAESIELRPTGEAGSTYAAPCCEPAGDAAADGAGSRLETPMCAVGGPSGASGSPTT